MLFLNKPRMLKIDLEFGGLKLKKSKSGKFSQAGITSDMMVPGREQSNGG